MSVRFGREFFKMTGSGNDFIVFDARTEPAGPLVEPEQIRALCARGTGVGADGVVFITPSHTVDFAIAYFNSDGSRAALCGNASLCTTSLAVELGIGRANRMAFETDAGVIHARFRGMLPEIDLQPVTRLDPAVDLTMQSGEKRLGYAEAGVPHAVVLCDDVDGIDLAGRGRALRWDRIFDQGANANFVSASGARWQMRTYERGVEAETLACGTGAVATALLLRAWGLAGDDIELETRSGQPLGVRVQREGVVWLASLRGEGRIIYRGALATDHPWPSPTAPMEAGQIGAPSRPGSLAGPNR